MDVEMSLPLLPYPGDLNPTVNSGAALAHDWQKFDIRRLNPHDASQPYKIGDTWTRLWAYIATSVSLGEDLGAQSYVLVIEEEHLPGDFVPTGGGGTRLERYLFAVGYGKVRQMARLDTDCTQVNPANCDGNYTVAQGILTLHRRSANDLGVTSIAPYNIVDWWVP
ncbi:MAG: hypothetical protein ACRDHL_13445 [Candidatus Promineifilaceae bacterium]